MAVTGQKMPFSGQRQIPQKNRRIRPPSLHSTKPAARVMYSSSKMPFTASVFVDTMSQSSIIPIRVIAVVITPIRTASFKLFVYEKHYKRSP